MKLQSPRAGREFQLQWAIGGASGSGLLTPCDLRSESGKGEIPG